MVETGMPTASLRAGGRALTAGRVAGLLSGSGLAWLVGIGLQLGQADLPGVPVLRGAGAAALLVGGTAWMCRGSSSASPAWRAGRSALALVAVALLAWAWTGLLAAQRLADRLPASLEGVDLVVTGVVADLPQSGPNGLRFRFEPEAAQRAGEGVQLPERLAIGWYTGWHEDASLSPPQASLRAGQRWTFTLRLRRPHGNLNPHGYDYELQLFEQGIGATGYVRDGPARPQMLAQAAGKPVAVLRQHVRDAIQAHVEDRRTAGVLAALAIGDQSAIAREDWELFRNTGIAHLVRTR